MAAKSLKRVAFQSALLIAWGAIFFVGGLWVWDSYSSKMEDISVLRTKMMDGSKQALENEVGLVVDYIESMKGQSRQRLEKFLQNRVDDLHSILQSLYDRYSGTMSDEELLDMIREAVRPLRFNNGRGYYFITTMQGVAVLLPPFPEMEGKSYFDEHAEEKWSPAAKVISELMERDRAVYVYMWPVPETNQDELKLSYVRRFDPLAIYIGAGEYMRYAEEDIQQEVLASLENLRFANDGYVLATSYEGISLLGPYKGRQMFELTDSNGVQVAKEMVELAKQGGGFLAYKLPSESTTDVHRRKMSYVAPVTDWDWSVGVGMGMDDVDALIDKEIQSARMAVFQHVGIILLVVVAVSFVVFLIGYRFINFVWGEFAVFTFMLGRAVKDGERMDENRLRYDEMVRMARTGNEMLEGRRLAQQRTESLKRHLQDVIDSMPSILLAVDAEGRVAQWNRAAVEEFGALLTHGVDIARLVPAAGKLLGNALKRGQPAELLANSRVGSVQGAYRDVVVYPLGESEGVCAVVRVDDVSERVRLEQMARHGEKMSTVGTLAAGMAHEINNPLGIILQSGQGIRRRLADGIPGNEKAAEKCGVHLDQLRQYMHEREIDSYLDALVDAGKRASAIVRNLLSFSKDELSGVEPCDLNSLLDRVLDLAESDYELRQLLDFRTLEVQRDYDEELPPVAGITSELEQVFLNIIRNSVQAMAGAMPEGRHPILNLRTALQADGVLVEMEDNGPGMDEQTRQRVFEPFFTTRSPGRGVGLGLSVSYFIITRNHGGEIRLESRPGHGARCTVILPLYEK